MYAETANDPLVETPEIADIPVIDVAPLLAGEPGATGQVAAGLRAACDGMGFFFISGHGGAPAVVERAFDASRRFFALPDAVKATVRMNRHQCGWMAPGISVHRDTFETRADALRPQTSQAFKFTWDLDPSDPDYGKGIRFRGHNQWPDPAHAPGLREAFLDFHATFEALALRLLAPLAVSLGLPADGFAPHFDRPSSMTRIACYPPVPDRADRVNTPGHRDLGFLTLIPPATMPGLEILTPDERWIAQPVLPDAILVNTGVTLQRWTNDRYVATPHRVRADAAETRYSNIFFLYPRVDAVVAALPTCTGPDNPPRYPAETFGEIHAAYCARNFAYAEGID
jgi:isopenicillin N synthase-like dioxygenase